MRNNQTMYRTVSGTRQSWGKGKTAGHEVPGGLLGDQAAAAVGMQFVIFMCLNLTRPKLFVLPVHGWWSVEQ